MITESEVRNQFRVGGRVHAHGVFKGVVGTQTFLTFFAGNVFDEGLRLRFVLAGRQHATAGEAHKRARVLVLKVVELNAAFNPKLVPLKDLDAPKVEPSTLNSKKVIELMTQAGLL